METRHLQVFTAVYRTRSFTKAASELFTSQPTVSEHMKNLEDRLDCKLFDRLGRSISPTPEAKLLYPRALAILEELDKLDSFLATASERVSGELVIGAGTIPGAYVLPQLAARFKDRYPDISFEILIGDSSAIIKKIEGHEIYLGVVGTTLETSKVAFTPFGGDELVLAAPPDDPTKEIIEVQELTELDLINRATGSGTGRTVARFLEQAGIRTNDLKICATLGSSTAIKEAVKSGLGAAFISKTAIRDELEAGRLKIITVEGLTMHRSFYVATPTKRTLPHHYQVFIDSLLG